MISVPEWICTLVGRLVLDNEALRREIAERDDPPEAAPPPNANELEARE